MAAKPIPEGYRSVTPYLVVDNASEAIAFYTRAFGAKELYRMPMPDGKIAHAEFRVGDAIVMIADEAPDQGYRSPKSLGGSSVSLMFYVDDVDAVAKRAVAEGLEVLRPVQDQFYGDRSGNFRDPFGHLWTIATHKEDLTPEEMNQRMEKMFGGGA